MSQLYCHVVEEQVNKVSLFFTLWQLLAQLTFFVAFMSFCCSKKWLVYRKEFVAKVEM